MLGQIWLIGGTQESAALAAAIAVQNLPCLITVTTESARALYPNVAPDRIWVGRLQTNALPNFLQTHSIVAILDASHPFAVEISQQAIAIAAQLNLPYLRFERAIVELEKAAAQESQGTATQVKTHNSQLTTQNLSFPGLQALVASDVLVGQRVLLTVGYRPLHWFASWHEQATLFTRILPSVPALEAAIAAGFTSDRILALRPPVAVSVERALWHQWQISLVVMKASGVAGGEAVKRQVAAEMGVQLVTIARPEMAYPQQTSEFAIALEFCRQKLIASPH